LVAIVASSQLATVGPPLFVVMAVASAIALVLYFRLSRDSNEAIHEPENPAQFSTAILVGLVYAVILILVAFAKNQIGQGGLYVVSVLSGLTDMDAITLSISNMMQNNRLDSSEAWRYILAAGLANLVFKAGITGVLGTRKLFNGVSLAFLVIMVAGGLVLWLW